MIRDLELNLLIRSQIFVNIFEGRRGRNRLENTKAKTVSLVRLMIRILADNNDLNFVDRGGFKGIKDVLFLGINL
jgi:hypothetical protein